MKVLHRNSCEVVSAMKLEEMSTLVIRAARLGDERGISRVIIDTWKTAYRGIVSDQHLESLTTQKHEELFKRIIGEQTEAVFVLEDHKKIVGMVSGGQDRSEVYDCELIAIYVLPPFQKQGFGKKLFKTLIDEHKRARHKSMIIWTFQENRDQQFYIKLGGTACHEQSCNIAGNEIALTGYVWQDIEQISFL